MNAKHSKLSQLARLAQIGVIALISMQMTACRSAPRSTVEKWIGVHPISKVAYDKGVLSVEYGVSRRNFSFKIGPNLEIPFMVDVQAKNGFEIDFTKLDDWVRQPLTDWVNHQVETHLRRR